MGPPDVFEVDKGSGYVSREMKAALEASAVRVEDAPIENPGRMGTVELYHAPLRSDYSKILESLDQSTTDAD